MTFFKQLFQNLDLKQVFRDLDLKQLFPTKIFKNGILKIVIIFIICLLTYLLCNYEENIMDYIKYFFYLFFSSSLSVFLLALPWILNHTGKVVSIIIMGIIMIFRLSYLGLEYFGKDWFKNIIPIFNYTSFLDPANFVSLFGLHGIFKVATYLFMLIIYVIELAKPGYVSKLWVVENLKKLNKFFFGIDDWNRETGNNIGNVFPRKGWVNGTVEEQTITLSLILIIGYILYYLVFKIQQNNRILAFITDEDVDGEGNFTLANMLILLIIYGYNFYLYLKDYGINWTPEVCNLHEVISEQQRIIDDSGQDETTRETATNLKEEKERELNKIGELKSRTTTNILFLINAYILCSIFYSRWRGKIGWRDGLKWCGYTLVLFIGPIIQLITLSDNAECSKETEKDKVFLNFLKITSGAYSSCIISIFLLAAFLLKVWGIMFGKYKLISIGVVPAINNLSRTFMLLIANIVGFLPYWLGKVEFGRI